MKIHRAKKSRFLIPVSSMADIAFLLLIFFMLSSIMDIEKEIPLKLPESRTSELTKEKFLYIWVNSRGDYFFDNQKNSIDNLIPYVKSRMVSNRNIKALIRADKNIPYKNIDAVLRKLKEAELYNIVFVSRKKNDS
jgi:biopolymer transport protein ExbD